MAQTSINIRIDEDLKRDFEAICSQLGLTMSAAFTVFAKNVSVRKEIPFKLTTKPNDQYEEWGHLFSGNLYTANETAGAAGYKKNKIPTVKRSAWADMAVKKEIKRQKDTK